MFNKETKIFKPSSFLKVLDDSKYNQFNNDSTFSTMFAEQLQMLDNVVVETIQADRTFLQDIPVRFTEKCDNAHTWFMNDINGSANIIGDYSTGLNKVGATGKAYVGRFVDFGVAYDLSIREMEKANAAKVDLEGDLIRAVTRSMIERHDDTAFLGSPLNQVFGWLQYSEKFTKTAFDRRVTTLDPVGANEDAKLWANKTGEEILQDLTSVVDAIDLKTNSKFMPDTILLPTAQYQRANNVRLLETSTVSVLEEFNRKYPEINVIKRPILKKALLNKDVMIAYKNDPICFNQIIGEVLAAHPKQAVNLVFTTNFTGRHGGIQMKLPETQCFMYGI